VPSMTLTNLRQGLVRSGLGDLETFTVTTAINADTSVVSTALRNLGYTNNDELNGRHVYLQDYANAQKDRVIGDYTGSSGTITVRGESLSDDSSNLATGELLPFNGNRLRQALNDARVEVVDKLFIAREYDTVSGLGGYHRIRLPAGLFIGAPTQVLVGELPDASNSENIIEDSDPKFEDADGSEHTATNITVADEAETSGPTNYVIATGAGSAKCLAVVDTAGTYYTRFTNSGNFDGERLNVFALVYSRTSGRVTASVNSGSQSDSSTTHSGNGWEILRHAVDLANPSTVDVGIAVSSGAVFHFYVDFVIAIAGPDEWATTQLDQMTTWRSWRPTGTGTDGYLYFDRPLPSMKWLKIRGHDYLSRLSGETDTMEVDEAEAELLYAYARRIIWNQEITRIADSESEAYSRAIQGRSDAEGYIEYHKRALARRRGSSPVRPGMLAHI